MAKKIDLNGLDHFKEKENASIAIAEATSTASAPHKVGEYFYYKGDLVIATADIAQGGTITLNTNCKKQPLADSVCELKTAISSEDTLINELHSLVNYSYDEPIARVADGAKTNSLQLGVIRNGTTIILNNTKANTINIRTRVNGEVTTTNSNTTVASWDGISLVTGHSYKFAIKHISGTDKIADVDVMPTVTVYRSGESSTIGTEEEGTDYYYRYFTAEENVKYNFCVYTPSGSVLTKAKYIVTLEDLTIKAYVSIGDVFDNENGDFDFAQGGYSRTGSKLGSSNAFRYLIQGDYVQPNVKKVYTNSSSYKITLHAWVSDAWTAFLTSENVMSSISTDPVYWADSIDFDVLRGKYPTYDFRVEITTTAQASGTNTNIYPEESKNVTFEEYKTAIRPYYESEMAKTLSDVHNSINEPSLVFPVVTDIHMMSRTNISTLFNVCADNITYLCDKIPCDFVMNLGDNTDGNNTPTETIRINKYMLEQFARQKIPYYIAIGNHDTNYYQSATKLTATETYISYLANTKGVHFDSTNFSYYKDFDELGVRLVVLDVNYLAQYTVNSATIDWLSNTALDTDNMVLLCEHLSSIPTQNWNGQSLGNGDDLKNAIQAFVTGGGTVVQLCGHSHSDYYFNSPWFVIFNGCQKLESVDTTEGGFLEISGNIGGNSGIVAPARTINTVTEDLWSVCVLKPLSKEIDFIRFGAGVDRYFHFGATAVTTTETLTSVLGTVTWTTSDSAVATVSNGTVAAVASGSCQITATDESGNFETWLVSVS